jgi:hypothetical protein
MRWFRLLCLGKQQSIDLLFIIDHYSLLCSVYLSLSFFCQQGLYAQAPLFAYTCHYTMFREHKHTCTNEADTEERKKSLNAAMTCICKGKKKKRNRTRTYILKLPDIEL